MSDYYPAGYRPRGDDRLPLFDPPPATPSATSVAAKASSAARSSTVRRRVLDLLCRRGRFGATDEEIREELDLPESTARPRRRELVKAGRAVASGQTRKSAKGCAMTVWVLPEHRPQQTS